MPVLIKELHPTARKEHQCMFCGCKIEVGEQYQRSTLKYEDDIYDWVNHEDCNTLTGLLDMYGHCDEGICKDDFEFAVQEYLVENYYDEQLDAVCEDVDKLSLIEQVRMIIADWNKPEFEIKRVKRSIAYHEYRERCHCITPRGAEHLSQLRTRLKSLEWIIKNVKLDRRKMEK